MCAEAYREPGRPFSVTIASVDRRRIFRDLDFGRACVEHLRHIRDRYEVPVYAYCAYCLMPDHVHLLVGVTEGADLRAIVGSWKSLCARSWTRRTGERTCWQRGFFDHAVRSSDGLLETARYILANPMRAGLVVRREDYELAGSLEWNL